MTCNSTYADILRPSVRWRAAVYDAALVVAGSLFVALCARIRIPLPFSPVPITGQTLAVLLTGMLLGRRRGVLSLAVYLAEGATGLPVFQNGNAGLAYMAGPTGGYLMGFVAAAYITGLLAERGWDRRMRTTVAGMLLGNIVLYALGLPWLARYVGVRAALPLGLYPFLPGDLLKVALATLALPWGWRLLGKHPQQRTLLESREERRD